MKKILLFAITAVLMASCSSTKNLTTRKVAYAQMYEQRPTSILVLPPVNRSTKVESKELFYSSLAAPITQFGFYVMPSILTMDILKEESAYDSEMFINGSMKKVGELFGADAVLFTIINDWSKTSIASQFRVNIEYILKSTKDDSVLFQRSGDVTVSVKMNSGNPLVDLIGSIALTAISNEIIAARCSNFYVLSDIPRGKYSPFHNQDSEINAQPQKFKITTTLQGAAQAAVNSANAAR